MLRTLLVSATALNLLMGVGFAQMSSTTSTTVTTPPIAPTHDVDVTKTTKVTKDRNGVTVDEDTRGTEITSPGRPGTSDTTTQTTIVR
jgi:hypothetical protein